MDPDQHYLTVKEAAALLRVSEWFIRAAIRRGEIVTAPISGVIRIPRAALDGRSAAVAEMVDIIEGTEPSGEQTLFTRRSNGGK